MTKDDIIRMARKAGFTNPEKFTTKDELLSGILADFWANLERFAALVAAERDKYWQAHIEPQIEIEVAKEREECAKVCENATESTEQAKEMLGPDELIGKAVASGAIHQSKKLAVAIRARTNHE